MKRKHLYNETPQFRSGLVRRLKNMAPGYTVEFVETNRGLAFRMKDQRGRYRSEVVRVYRNHDGHALDRSLLERLLERAGFPGVTK